MNVELKILLLSVLFLSIWATVTFLLFYAFQSLFFDNMIKVTFLGTGCYYQLTSHHNPTLSPPPIATTVFGRVCCWDSVLICHTPTWLHSVKSVLWLLLIESHFFYPYFLIASYVRNTNSPCCINYSCRAFAIRIHLFDCPPWPLIVHITPAMCDCFPFTLFHLLEFVTCFFS